MTHITLPRATVEQALEALRFYAEESHHLTLTGFKNGKRIDWDQERDRLEKAGYRFAHENHNSTEAYVEDGRRARDALNNLEEALAQQAEPEEPMAWANIDSDRLRVDPATGNVSIGAQQAEPVTIERLRDALVASRIIQPAAVEDPDEYDDGVTLFRIEALHRRIT